MKRLTCIVLTAVMALMSFALTACNSESDDGHIQVLATADINNKNENNKSKAKTAATEASTVEQATVSSSELTKTQNSAFVSDCESILYSYGFEGEVYITEHNKPIYKKGINYADKKKKIMNNEYTLFRVASITKQFTAAAIMLLQERGKLSVKDKLGKYFSQYKSGKDVTIQNVLRMQGGLPDYMNYYSNVSKFFPSVKQALKNTSKQNRQIIEKNFMGDPMLFSQGNTFKYSNSGYMLLGEIIEKVSGTTYENFIRTEIFDKLGMNNSGFVEELDESIDNIAQPYNYKKGDMDVFKIKGAAFACGNMYSNAVDLTKWADGLRKCKIISKSSLNEMLENTKQIGYGYGLFLLAGGTVAFHTGSLAPYNSIILISFGSTEYTCVAMSNYNYYATERVGKALREQYARFF